MDCNQICNVAAQYVLSVKGSVLDHILILPGNKTLKMMSENVCTCERISIL